MSQKNILKASIILIKKILIGALKNFSLINFLILLYFWFIHGFLRIYKDVSLFGAPKCLIIFLFPTLLSETKTNLTVSNFESMCVNLFWKTVKYVIVIM